MDTTRFIDYSSFTEELNITLPIYTGMEVYKGRSEKQPQFTTLSDHQSGSVFESEIKMNLHTGTHIDAPLHILEDGEDVSCFGPEYFQGRALVIDLQNEEKAVDKAVLVRHRVLDRIKEVEFLLIRTSNSVDGRDGDDFAYLAQSGAELLSKTGLKGVGIDALGIERSQPGHPTHKVLMNNSIMIIEGLELQSIKTGTYFLQMTALPLSGVEALPVIAKLFR